MQDFYKKNIEALIKVDPVLGVSLFAIQENTKFDVYQGKDPLDINIINNETKSYLYEKPLEELERTLENIQEHFIRFPVLFFYGIGNGLLTKALLQNESLKHLVIVEPDIEMIYIALNFIDIADEIASQRVIIKSTSTFNFANAVHIIYKGDVKPYAKIYDLHIHSPYYEQNYADSIMEVNTIFIRAYKHMVLGHGNDAIDSLIGIEQHINNLPLMLQNYKTSDLLESKNSDLAVVVSTGPSLAKQLPLLKEYADYVTIICIDASLPILQKEGIKPDFVVSMERVPLTSKFFEDLDDELVKDTYFVVSSLTHQKTVNNLKNRKLILSMRPLSYMRYYDFKEYGYLGSGMSAANMGYQLALRMKYNKVVLIGQDLAYSDDGKSHSKGHIFTESEVKHSNNDLEVIRYGGDGLIRTTYIWDMFKNYFERAIDEANEHNIKTYNSTEGGARIVGSIEMPFKEVLTSFVPKEKKKSKIFIEKVQKEDYLKLLKEAYKKTENMLEYGIEVKKDVEELFLKVSTICEEMDALEQDQIDYDSLLRLMDEIDVIKEKIETLEFSKMYIDTVQSYIFHQELDLAKLVIQSSNTDEEKKAKLVEWIQKHRYWLFSLAGGLEAQITAITRGRSELVIECRKNNCLPEDKDKA